MSKIRLTKEFSFEMAHALTGYDGLCREIHGHSYRLFVTVVGEPVDDVDDPKYGMVMDFGALKKIVNEKIVDLYDHSLVLRRLGNEELMESLRGQFARVRVVDYQPTCENFVSEFAAAVRPALPAGVELFSIKLHETATSFAEWFAADNL